MSKRDSKRVLLIDRSVDRDRLRAALAGSGYAVATAALRDEALAVLRNGFKARVIVLGDDGHGAPVASIMALRELQPGVGVVVIASGPVALDLDGPVESVQRSRCVDDLDAAIVRVLECAAETQLPPDTEQEATLIAASPRMRSIRNLIRQVADTDVPVLITGDSGVGKEVIARALHRESNRVGPFVKVNCAALPDQLLESELFGYEPGAFTGADRKKPGKFELAHGGTILLDEIGEISRGTQAKLLQVLQDGCYFRLGGAREISVDARVVASTNRRLEEAMVEGSFRKDLFYRLNVVRIEVPRLCERPEEVPLLAQHFVSKYESEYGRRIGVLSDATLDALGRHDWPGNVRELENLVRRMVVLQDVDGALESLRAARLDGPLSALNVATLIGSSGEIPPLKEVSRLAALEVEGELIRRALERTSWNRREAAKLLRISYKALLYKIRDCGISKAA